MGNFSETLHYQLIYALQLVLLCHVAVVIKVSHYIYITVGYIFSGCSQIEIIGFILSQFENRVLRKPVLGIWVAMQYCVTAHEQSQSECSFLCAFCSKRVLLQHIIYFVSFKMEATLNVKMSTEKAVFSKHVNHFLEIKSKSLMLLCILICVLT